MRRNGSERVGALARIRYRLDNALARGVAPVIAVLAGVTGAVVLAAGLVLWIARINLGGGEAKPTEGVWQSLLRVLDTGTMAGDATWPFRLVSLAVTLTGIFLASTLIGLIATGFANRVNELRRGQSKVIEKGHTLVLGWSPRMFLLLNELAAAAEDGERRCVVVLADVDTIVMDDAIRQALSADRRLAQRIRVVTRSGHPADPVALARVAPTTARSVIVLADSIGGDPFIVRCVLSLENLGVSTTTPVVIELDDPSRAAALRAASSLSLLPVDSEEWIARITARVVADPPMADVYQDLLDFGGSELYLRAAEAQMVGRPVGAVASGLRGGWLVGVLRADTPILAPDPSMLVAADDDLIVLARTRSAVTWRPVDESSMLAIPVAAAPSAMEIPETIGIVGWGELGRRTLAELDTYLPHGSRIRLLVEDDDDVPDSPPDGFHRFTLAATVADPTSPTALTSMVSDRDLDRIVLFAGRGRWSRDVADSRVLLSLLELRHLLDEHGHIDLIAELLDPRSVELVRGSRSEVFVVGERLISLLMTQMSQEPRLEVVLRCLLEADGADLATIDASEAVALGQPITAADLASALRRWGWWFLGVRVEGRTVLDPDAATEFRFGAGDRIVAIRP